MESSQTGTVDFKRTETHPRSRGRHVGHRIHSAAIVLATVLMASMALAAFAAPAKAISPGPPEINVTVTGHFADTIDTELVALSLTGSFSAQGMLPAGPINDHVSLVARMQIFAHFTVCEDVTGCTGFSEVFGNDMTVDVSVHVGTRADPETGRAVQVSSLDVLARWEAGTFLHELGHTFGLSHGGAVEMSTAWEGDTATGASQISVMNYRYQSAGISRDDGNLAKFAFDKRFSVLAHDPGPARPNAAPSVQADSFFDVFVAAALPNQTGTDVQGPGILTHQRGVDATSSFAAYAQVATQPGPVLSPLNLELTETDGDGFSELWETNGAIDINCDGLMDSDASFHTLHGDLDLSVMQGFQYSGEQNKPGPINLPGTSFFDIFYELETPMGHAAGSSPSTLQARVEQPSEATGLAEISGNDFLTTLGAADYYCINC